MPEHIAVICVHIEMREGSYFAYSDDLPGLHVCGTELQAVKADLAPMIAQLYKLRGMEVEVRGAADALSLEMPSDAANADSMRFVAAPRSEALAA